MKNSLLILSMLLILTACSKKDDEDQDPKEEIEFVTIKYELTHKYETDYRIWHAAVDDNGDGYHVRDTLYDTKYSEFEWKATVDEFDQISPDWIIVNRVGVFDEYDNDTLWMQKYINGVKKDLFIHQHGD